jgi:cyclase
MLRPRIIPVLLLTESGLVKTERFKTRRYIGDPINALRVFNDKEVDEIVILDIDATPAGRGPDFDRIGDLAGECFMPMAYGGGIRSVAEAERLFSLGVEKVILGTRALEQPELVSAISASAGAQSVAVCLDFRRNWLGRNHVFVRGGKKDTGRDPVEVARQMQDLGAGEIILQSMDRDGTAQGYDVALIGEIASELKIPLVACGGAGTKDDFRSALGAGAAAAAAGSFFVFYGKHRAVLISYLDNHEIMNLKV